MVRKSLPSFRTSRWNKSSSSVNVTNEVPLSSPPRSWLVLVSGFSWFSPNGPISPRPPRLLSPLSLSFCLSRGKLREPYHFDTNEIQSSPGGSPSWPLTPLFSGVWKRRSEACARERFAQSPCGTYASGHSAESKAGMCIRVFMARTAGKINNGRLVVGADSTGSAYDACTRANSPPRVFVHRIVWRESSQNPGAIFFSLVEGTRHRIAPYQI
jgi:hypothetical protein